MTELADRSRISPKATQRREEILNAAVRCFKKKGFHAASMSSIAKEFGMSAGLIYNYFDSKESIIEAIVDRWVREYGSRIHIQWDHDRAVHRVEVERVIDSRLSARAPHADDLSLFFEIMAEGFRNEKIADCLRRAGVATRSLIRAQAVACYRKNGFEPPEDLDERIAVISSMFNGMLFEVAFNPESSRKKLVPVMADTLMFLESKK
ncbi:MAG: TetR/AcrR family transcriptional regulator [Sutterellaceae bacterium]|nr:TetR/AcrR family transcriptional regulator [Sutterellaceae bacterium]MDD7441733.1 TetR/AcrR family transcriptional regulator [Sutterellaceae bacterium]MDY2869257.1 TetR/AcrR family transcriptional regulator [Mesosutterella sp.]